MRKKDKQTIIELLEKRYNGIGTALHYNSPFELLCAVIMSAQCTDERINKITARIFPRLNTPEKMGALTQEQLEIPKDIPTLMKLPGVGRKTADVIASVIYKVPAIAVDTHVFRTSHRLGLSDAKTPEATELDLQKLIPKSKWADSHHWFIWHGRLTCKARKPLCDECVCLQLCPFKEKNLINEEDKK